MKERIEILENLGRGVSWKELNINPTFGNAYLYSLEVGNEVPNFGDVIWDQDIEAIIENCKRFGITEFTISSTFSGLTNTIAQFIEFGCKLDGIVKINSCYKDYMTGKFEIVPAFKMSI